MIKYLQARQKSGPNPTALFIVSAYIPNITYKAIQVASKYGVERLYVDD